MKIYPAIDIYNGKCVRLYKGDLNKITEYGDPLKIALDYSKYSEKLHIIDLNGAFEGIPKNLDIVKKIKSNSNCEIQVGGGFRTKSIIKKAYSLGIDNVIISSAALEESFLNEIVKDFKITISLDFKDNKMFIKGWKEKSDLTFENALNIFSKYTRRFIYTEISKDGTLAGIENIPKINSDFDFIYAGGISSKEDIEKLKTTGFNGVIIGKAIYENKLSLKELI